MREGGRVVLPVMENSDTDGTDGVVSTVGKTD